MNNKKNPVNLNFVLKNKKQCKITIEFILSTRSCGSKCLYKNFPVSFALDIKPSSKSPASKGAATLGSVPSSNSGLIPNPPTREFYVDDREFVF